MGYGRYWQPSVVQAIIDERLKMKDMNEQVIAYLKSRVSSYKRWAKSGLRDMLEFYRGLGQLMVSQDETGKVDGVMAFQLINTINEINGDTNDWNAEGVHIQILSAETSEVREKLVRQAIAVCGTRSWISFERAKYGLRLSKLPFSLAERIACYGR